MEPWLSVRCIKGCIAEHVLFLILHGMDCVLIENYKNLNIGIQILIMFLSEVKSYVYKQVLRISLITCIPIPLRNCLVDMSS